MKKRSLLRISALTLALLSSPLAMNAQLSTDDYLGAHWKFDETSGTTAEDSAGFGDYHGTINPSHITMGIPGVDGTAFRFAGNDDDTAPINISDHPWLITDIAGEGDFDDVTFSFWYRVGDLPGGLSYSVFSVAASARSDKYIEMGVNGDERPYGKQRNPTDGTVETRPGSPGQNEWHHIVYVIDADYGQQVYVNGVFSRENTGTRRSMSDSEDGWPVNQGAIGCLYRGDVESKRTDYFKGDLDDLRVYGLAFSAAEVTELYDSYFDIVGVDKVNENIASFKVYPNPATNYTDISFDLKSGSDVEISLTDLSGRTVKSIDTAHYSAGSHVMNLDLTNDGGLASGIYLLNLVTDGYTSTQKVIVE